MTRPNKLMLSEGHHHEHNDEDEVDFLQPTMTASYIYDKEGKVPSGYNAVKIALNASLKADLNWEKERQTARGYAEKGLLLFWEIHFGLFHNLSQPIGSQSQFLSFSLSLEHFRDTLWKEFKKETIGLCLYRGSADFSVGFPWDEEQRANLNEWLQERFHDSSEELFQANQANKRLQSVFCRDVAGEYLELLARRLPDTLPCYVLLDGSGIDEPSLLAQLTTKERFSGLRLGIKADPCYGGEIGWDSPGHPCGLISNGPIVQEEMFTIQHAICLPSLEECRTKIWDGIAAAMSLMKTRNIPFRLIPESMLTTEWDGLDYLFVVSEQVSLQGRRKLQGFCAAGGTVVTIGDPLGLANEVSAWQ